ncbi:probable transcription factor PosF21 isoform X1 [Zingiber officinale]|uniref:probable transcription factor PosF21 isoform X1 n=1 Tax=Zingiber officinale TaxID=94328 RepID=UPI001C4CEB5C|nr:probable transcription factor PosF21 isoform X1 [Zingiber officinale]
MEKDKSAGDESSGFGGLPPPSPSRYGAFATALTSSSFPAKAGAPSSSSNPSDDRDDRQFSHDIKRMPDFPRRSNGHRRAHSEILSLPDDISFDSDLGIVGAGEGPSLSEEIDEDLISMYLDMDKIASSSASSVLDLLESETLATGSVGANAENVAETSSERPRIRHQHSQSFDGSTTIKREILASGAGGMSLVEEKKAISAAKLAELALVDPKRAKRVWANRQSAARSKERKMRYISELERKIMTLQTEATTLSAQLTMLQRDNTGLNSENNELKLRVQTMEQQVHLQDALNETLRDEVQRLKLATGTAAANSGQMVNYGQSSFGVNQQYYHKTPPSQSLMAAHQLQQLHLHSQQQRPQQYQGQPLQRQSSAEIKPRFMASQTQKEGTSDNSNGAPQG